MQNDGSFKDVSGASKNFFEFTHSKTWENALFARKTNITFIIGLQSEKKCMSLSESL